MDVLEKLISLSDTKYKEFHSSLCPTVDSHKIIGVKVPVLRKLAKDLYKENNSIVDEIGNTYYEEIMLKGLIIASYNLEFKEKIKVIEPFVDIIDNWAICDIFCSSLKIKKSEKEEYFEFIKKYLKSNEEFKIRFMIVMLLDNYIDEEYLDRDFSIISKINNDSYYVKMAIAWFISTSYIKYPKYTLEKLKEIQLDKWTYNKSLQKIIESKRVSIEDKEMIKKLKV